MAHDPDALQNRATEVPAPRSWASELFTETALATIRELSHEVRRLVERTSELRAALPVPDAARTLRGWYDDLVAAPELQARVTALQARIAELEATVARERAEHGTLARRAEERIAAAEQGRATALHEAEVARRAGAEGRDAYARLENETATLRGWLAEAQDRVAVLEADLRSSMEAAGLERQVAEKAQAEREAQWRAQRAALEATCREAEARSRTLDAELSRCRVEIDARERALARTSDVGVAAEAGRTAVADLERMRDALAESRADLQSTRTELTLAVSRLAALERAHEDVLAERTRLATDLASAATREAELERRLAPNGASARPGVGVGAHDEPAFPPLPVEETGPGAAASPVETAVPVTAAPTERETLPEAAAERADVTEETASPESGLEAAGIGTTDEPVADAPLVAVETPAAAIPALAYEKPAGDAPSDERVDVAYDEPADLEETEPDEAFADAPIEVVRTAPQTCELVVAAEPAAGEPAPSDDDPERTHDDDVTDGRAVTDDAGASDRTDAAAATSRVAVLDGIAPWDADAPGAIVPVGPDAAARLQALDPACCVVNLGSAEALATVVAIRAQGVRTPLWGCVTDADADRAAGVGPFDVLARPVAADAVHAQLGAMLAASAKVVVVGSDSATLIPLRQGLLAGGGSVRVAWNCAQASDLVAATHPEMLVVDLAQPVADTAPFVATLAAAGAVRLVLVLPTDAAALPEFCRTLATALLCDAGETRRALLARAAS